MNGFKTSFLTAALTALVLGGAVVSPARADLTNCQGVYVIQLFVDSGGGTQVMFGNSPNDTTGSAWQYLVGSGMTEAAYQRFFSMLLTAKSTKAPVLVSTDASNGCSLSSTNTLTSLYLRPTP
jgi:hypothetical protein